MSDWADSIPQNSYQTIEQEYLNFQAEFLPARSTAAQTQDSLSTPSPTPPLISSPRQMSVEFYDLPWDLTSDFERPAHYSSVTMTNLANQLPSYDSDAIPQANSSLMTQQMQMLAELNSIWPTIRHVGNMLTTFQTKLIVK